MRSTVDAQSFNVKAPTLLIVCGDDEPVIEMNRDAMVRCARTSGSRSCRVRRTSSKSQERWSG